MLRGHLDLANLRQAAGWAQEDSQPDVPVSLLVLDNDNLIGRILANRAIRFPISFAAPARSGTSRLKSIFWRTNLIGCFNNLPMSRASGSSAASIDSCCSAGVARRARPRVPYHQAQRRRRAPFLGLWSSTTASPKRTVTRARSQSWATCSRCSGSALRSCSLRRRSLPRPIRIARGFRHSV
jgi:hypothetical protein